MYDLFSGLRDWLQSDEVFAYCRLVATRGSTPQKPGAAMLVRPDGSQLGTLGGGCVEAEVKRKSIGMLPQGGSDILRFQLDHDYGWDDGLICGGRMDVLVDAVAPGNHYYQQLAKLGGQGGGYTEVIRVDTAGEPPAGAAWLLNEAGDCVVQRSDLPHVPQDVLLGAKPLAQRPRPYLHAGYAFLPLLSRCRLVIVGGGHVGQAVAHLATDLDFEVWVVDDRAEYVTADRFPQADQRRHGDLDQLLPALPITPQTYCIIVTRGHSHDQLALFHLAARQACYVGMIGSRRKIKLILDNLRQEGIADEALQAVHAPLGINIGSQTVPEIAVSICAELVAHRNLGNSPRNLVPTAE